MNRIEFQRLCICGVPLDSLSADDVLEIISKRIQAKKKTAIYFTNASHLVNARFDAALKKAYSAADLSLPDGVPLVWISRLFGSRLPQRICATDFVPALCKRGSERGFSFFLLGGTEEVAGKAKETLMTKCRGLHIAGNYSPPLNTAFCKDEVSEITERINRCNPDIVLVALGGSKQEKWIHAYAQYANAHIFMGIGGTFDFISGQVKRAPLWMRRSGLEWLFRLYQEPRRLWKRYLIGNSLFLFLVLEDIVRKGVHALYGTKSTEVKRYL
jgi:N-acetylglucosaminyldiphosphoundecaprenol N-acetyl-beta-D-mannosaminyltransferase